MNSTNLMYREGSCLLTIMIIVTLISLFCITIWRTTLVAFDLSLMKQEYEQQFQPTKGVMMWALDAAKNNFDTFYTYANIHKEGARFEIPHLNIHHTTYNVDLVFKQKKEASLSIIVHLYCKKAVVCCLSCCLTKQQTQDTYSYKVSEWTTHGV